MNGSDEPPLIAVLDYGIGNLRSAQKGFERAGADKKTGRLFSELFTAVSLKNSGIGLPRRFGCYFGRTGFTADSNSDSAARKRHADGRRRKNGRFTGLSERTGQASGNDRRIGSAVFKQPMRRLAPVHHQHTFAIK